MKDAEDISGYRCQRQPSLTVFHQSKMSGPHGISKG
jgi:hypothetical protein